LQASILRPTTSVRLYGSAMDATCGEGGRHCSFKPPGSSTVKLDNPAVILTI
jgi:hypothetical protein